MSTTKLAAGAAEILRTAERLGLEEPTRFDVEHVVDLALGSVESLRAWAEWAGFEVESAFPQESTSGGAFVLHTAVGEIYEIPVKLRSYEWGRILPASSWECGACGASGGSSAGFVADDEYFEATSHVCSVAAAEVTC